VSKGFVNWEPDVYSSRSSKALPVFTYWRLMASCENSKCAAYVFMQHSQAIGASSKLDAVTDYERHPYGMSNLRRLHQYALFYLKLSCDGLHSCAKLWIEKARGGAGL